MQAFYNDPKIKEKYISHVKAHAAADEIIKGTYWNGGKGCAVGCTIHSNNHMAYESELGIPVMLAYLEDRIFEGASNEWSQSWPLRFLESIPVGTDLSKVGLKFQHWLLVDPVDGVIKFVRKKDRKIIKEISGLIWDLVVGKETDISSMWSAAWSAAVNAAESAAESAAYERQGEKLLELIRGTK